MRGIRRNGRVLQNCSLAPSRHQTHMMDISISSPYPSLLHYGNLTSTVAATIIFLLNIISVVVNWNGSAQIAAIVCAIVSLWALGIFSNFTHDRQNAPDYAVLLSLGSGIGAVVLIIIAAVS